MYTTVVEINEHNHQANSIIVTSSSHFLEEARTEKQPWIPTFCLFALQCYYKHVQNLMYLASRCKHNISLWTSL